MQNLMLACSLAEKILHLWRGPTNDQDTLYQAIEAVRDYCNGERTARDRMVRLYPRVQELATLRALPATTHPEVSETHHNREPWTAAAVENVMRAALAKSCGRMTMDAAGMWAMNAVKHSNEAALSRA